MPGQVTHFYTAARMAYDFPIDASDDVMPCVRDGIRTWIAANNEFTRNAHRINKENTSSSDDHLDAEVKKYRRLLLDNENIAIFSAFAAGAVGPDLWTIPGSSWDALSPTSKMIDGSWYFDMGHYNCSHVFPVYTLWQIKSNYGSWKTLQRKYRTAYILGFISHICTDIVVHPLVNVFAGAYHQQTQSAWQFERGPLPDVKSVSIQSPISSPKDILNPGKWKNPLPGLGETIANTVTGDWNKPLPVNKWNDHNKIEHFWDGIVRYLCFEGYHSSIPANFKTIRANDFGQSEDWNFPNYTDYWSKVLDSTIDDLSDEDELLLDVSTSLAGPFGQCYTYDGERKVDPFIREFYYDAYKKVDSYISENHEGSLHPSNVKDEAQKLEFFYLEYGTAWLSTQKNYLNWNLPGIADTFNKGSEFFDPAVFGRYLQTAIKLGASYIQKSLEYIKSGTEDDLYFLHNWNLDLGNAIRIKEMSASSSPDATVPVCIDLISVFDDEAIKGNAIPPLSTTTWGSRFAPVSPDWVPTVTSVTPEPTIKIVHTQKLASGTTQLFKVKESQPVSIRMKQICFYDSDVDCNEIAAFLFGSVEKSTEPWSIKGNDADTYTLKGYQIQDCVENFTPAPPFTEKKNGSTLGKASQEYSTVYRGGTGSTYIAEGDSTSNPKLYYMSRVERCMPRHVRVAWCRKYTCTPNTTGTFKPDAHNRYQTPFPSEEMVLSVFALMLKPDGNYKDLFYDVEFTQAQVESLQNVKVIGINTIVLLFKVNEKGSLRMYEAWVDGQKQITKVQKPGSSITPPVPSKPEKPPVTPTDPSDGQFVEIPDVLFNLNSAIPILDQNGVLVTSLLAVYKFVKDNPGKEITIFGHTDTSGDPAYNFKLSGWRAESVKALLDGNAEKWLSSVNNASNVEDYQSILKTLATTYKMDCDPGKVDNANGPKTKKAVGSFQCIYNKNFSGSLKVDGVMGPKTWKAMFDVLRHIVTDACKDEGCDAVTLKYGYNNTGIYPCGESFPIDQVGVDNYVSRTNRRVEVMFFNSGAMPNLSAPSSASSVSKSEAPVFDSSKVVVKPAPPATKPKDKSLFEDIINWAGFEWDDEQGIFYSRINAWQHNVGYFEIYDIGAPLFLMFIDCEPIRFKYDNRSWNIELWKGQYGICTGAEIGIYVGEFQLDTGNSSIDHTVNRLKFGDDTNCASGDDMLAMSFVLKKNGRVLFTRDSDDKKTPEVETHWWLTGFKPGEVSSASELQMDLSITFKDEFMRDSFVNALTGMGYNSSGIKKDGKKVSFTYGTPKSKQPGIFSSLDISDKFDQISKIVTSSAGNVISKVTSAIPDPVSGTTIDAVKKVIPNPFEF